MRRVSFLLVSAVLFLGALFAFQRPFREYPGVEYDDFPKGPDWNEKTEWAFARLMYPPIPNFGYRYSQDWKHGGSNWTIDYPRSDRHLSAALRRLTRLHVRSVEQPVDLDEGDQYDWPWLYGVEVGHWNLTDFQAKSLREFLLRGGFFMCDDFHGRAEWAVFIASMNRVFPDREIVEIPTPDGIFHSVYDLNDRYQVPGLQYVYSGSVSEKDGTVPHWRGIYDDRGRVMVAMTFNQDLGDSWEHADNPQYPQRFSALGLRVGVNYVIYAMTH
ncbi:MAG TPA: DUF4159 domain-containing protein [Bryobacteraceae bacterium]|jgi:hypothetical protein|nr:DUF4159 domain-containing protein [Bryobacteraceae bacterium]